jgi:hypothetical protein
LELTLLREKKKKLKNIKFSIKSYLPNILF